MTEKRRMQMTPMEIAKMEKASKKSLEEQSREADEILDAAIAAKGHRLNGIANVPKPEGYSKVAVWPATMCRTEDIPDFEETVYDRFRIRIKFLEMVYTNPGYGAKGGRPDVFFAVHDEDAKMFPIFGKIVGAFWLGYLLNAYDKDEEALYPERVRDYLN